MTMMKKLMLSICTVLALGIFPVMAGSDKVVCNSTKCEDFFKDHELNVAIWGGDSTRSFHRNYITAGVDAKYFVNKYVGVGVSSRYTSNHGDTGATLATATVRYPVGRFAPYAFGGVGAAYGHGTHATEQVGGGVEARITPRTGIFTDYSWNFNNDSHEKDFGLLRGGVNFSF